MRGYDESIAGTFIPPGLAKDKLILPGIGVPEGMVFAGADLRMVNCELRIMQ
jgi:hypothetical protein